MKLKGRIIDEHGNPVSHATVEIRVGETVLARVTSGSDGGFQFSSSGAPVGDAITLVVTKEGYLSAQVTKALGEGGFEDWTVTVKPSNTVAPTPIVPEPPNQIPWRVLIVAAMVLLVGGVTALLVIGKGVNMPDLVDIEVGLASKRVTDLDLKLERMMVITTNVAEGRVAVQLPAPGTRVQPGADVVLFIAARSTVPVPNVVGRSEKEARQAITDAKLNAKPGGLTGAAAVRRTVVSQRPNRGEEVERGSDVTYVIK